MTAGNPRKHGLGCSPGVRRPRPPVEDSQRRVPPAFGVAAFVTMFLGFLIGRNINKAA